MPSNFYQPKSNPPKPPTNQWELSWPKTSQGSIFLPWQASKIWKAQSNYPRPQIETPCHWVSSTFWHHAPPTIKQCHVILRSTHKTQLLPILTRSLWNLASWTSITNVPLSTDNSLHLKMQDTNTLPSLAPAILLSPSLKFHILLLWKEKLHLQYVQVHLLLQVKVHLFPFHPILMPLDPIATTLMLEIRQLAGEHFTAQGWPPPPQHTIPIVHHSYENRQFN